MKPMGESTSRSATVAYFGSLVECLELAKGLLVSSLTHCPLRPEFLGQGPTAKGGC
jgi:hypothetical protein